MLKLPVWQNHWQLAIIDAHYRALIIAKIALSS
jgi:hypothetical protein